jgi:hypothetical protein
LFYLEDHIGSASTRDSICRACGVCKTIQYLFEIMRTRGLQGRDVMTDERKRDSVTITQKRSHNLRLGANAGMHRENDVLVSLFAALNDHLPPLYSYVSGSYSTLHRVFWNAVQNSLHVYLSI